MERKAGFEDTGSSGKYFGEKHGRSQRQRAGDSRWTGYREHRSGLCKTGRNDGNGCYRKSWMWKEHNASENRADGIGSG